LACGLIPPICKTASLYLQSLSVPGHSAFSCVCVCVCVCVFVRPGSPSASLFCGPGLFVQDHLFFFFFFLWDWGLNSGLCICKAGALLLQPYLQSIFLRLFWRWCLKNFSQASLPISASQQSSKITGVSHWCQASGSSLISIHPNTLYYICKDFATKDNRSWN
jgi:hypothetical protein